MVVGRTALEVSPPTGLVAGLVGASAASNVWLSWRARRPELISLLVPGLLVCGDVAVLTALLLLSGGVANAVSVFFIVHIVLAALVLGGRWTWGITALCIAGYSLLFQTRPADLSLAEAMHPTIDQHITGMWWAFTATALIVAVMVARLASAIAKRDRALAAMRDEANRSKRLAGLATLAAGAAHELSTPLGTIAVTARELELALERVPADAEARADIALIRSELVRCRTILDDLSATAGHPSGEMPAETTAASMVSRAVERLAAVDRARVDISEPTTAVPVRWPADAMTRALTNLIRNGLQASAGDGRVSVVTTATGSGHVTIVIEDHGAGIPPSDRDRVGEPFYTTRPEGAGMGLGVFVARSTVERLGGRLTIDSEPGRGTRVRLSLPARVMDGAGGPGGPE